MHARDRAIITMRVPAWISPTAWSSLDPFLDCPDTGTGDDAPMMTWLQEDNAIDSGDRTPVRFGVATLFGALNCARVRRRFAVNSVLVALVVLGLQAGAHPQGAAMLFDLPRFPWANRVFYAGLVVALLALTALAWRLVRRLSRLRRRWEDAHTGANGLSALPTSTTGTVVVEFALVFPILLVVASMIVQLALFANASLVVRYAAFVAARSAVVSFRRELIALPPWQDKLTLPWMQGGRGVRHPDIELSAELVLASLSPRLGTATDPDAQSAAAAMEGVLQQRPGGAWVGREFATRMLYAVHATEVKTIEDDTSQGAIRQWYSSLSGLFPEAEHIVPPAVWSQGQISVPLPQIPYLNTLKQIKIPIGGVANVFNAITRYLKDPFSPKRVEVEVTYYFRITMPGVLGLIPGLTQPAPVVGGEAYPITHVVSLQSTGSREGNAIPWALVPVKWLFEKIPKKPLYGEDPFENLPIPFKPNLPQKPKKPAKPSKPTTPSTPTPSNPTPSNPTPSNPTPSNPTPSNPTPSNPSQPSNPDPSQPKPPHSSP